MRDLSSAARETTSRSTTTAIECFTFFFNSILSDRSLTSPSTRTRTKPALRTSSNADWNSPLRASTSGASTMIRAPSGISRTASMICSDVCCWIGRWHFGQCG